MKKSNFQKVIKDSQKMISKVAEKNGCLWFYQLHQKDIIKSANRLLKLYPEANKKIVLISCWILDIAYYYVKDWRDIVKVRRFHHIRGAEIAERFLEEYGLRKEEISKIKNCILRHRNIKNYQPENLEEKVVAVSDTLSHFESIFYFTFFKSFPQYSLRNMVKANLKELKKDWQDIQILPKVSKLIKMKYKILRQFFENYRN